MGPKLDINKSNKLKPQFLIAVVVIVTVIVVGVVVLSLNNQGDTNQQDDIAADLPVPEGDMYLYVPQKERETINPYTEVTVVADREISMSQNNRASMSYVGTQADRLYYIVTVSNLPSGKTTPVNLTFTDTLGNEEKVELEITRDPYTYPAGLAGITSWEDTEYILDGDDFNAAVSKSSRLLEDYEPDDLMDLNADLGLYTLNNAQLRSEAAYALRDMLNALAAATDKYVTVASGYRSFLTQAETYAYWVQELGLNKANEVSARPGHSEHQLGTTIDFVSEDTNWQITNGFGSTTAGQWLAENCKNYGFIIPYNEDQTDNGGYKEESWHFRYVGAQ